MPPNQPQNTEPQNAAASKTEGAVAEALPDFDTEELVEAAEQLLREGAPHDFDLLIIGGGPGGTTAALRAAEQGARVGLIESREVGGVHVNRGSVPLCALLESVAALRTMRRAHELGLKIGGEAGFDWPALWARRGAVASEVRSQLEAHLEALGVTLIRGRARFVEAHSVEVARSGEPTRRFAAVNVLIATGAVPARLQVPGVDAPGVLSTREIWEIENLPRSLAIVGAGVVGVAFAYLFANLGVPVTLLDQAPHLLPLEDADIGREMERALRESGVEVRCDTKLQSISADSDGLRLTLERDGQLSSQSVEKLLVTAGRKPNTEHLDLEAARIQHRAGRIQVDEQCQTNVPGVFAVGDCIRGAGWAHQAAAEGALVADVVTGYAPQNDLRLVPHCCYTQPEMASLGHSERVAQWAGLEIRVGIAHFRANSRATATGDNAGFVKIVADAATDQIVGCQIIGPCAGELINEVMLAMRAGLTARELGAATHAFPTFGEALAEAARRASGGDNEVAA